MQGLEWVPQRKVLCQIMFARSAPQKAVRVLKYGAVMVLTLQWDLNELGGEISKLWVRKSPQDENKLAIA